MHKQDKIKKKKAESNNQMSLSAFFFFRELSAAEQHYQLSCEDSQEHTQWVNGRIANGGSLTRAD